MRLFERGFCCLRPILLVGMGFAGGHSFLLVAGVSIHFCWSCDFLLVIPHSCWYALTANPTIYASLVRQFWGSASEVSLPDGVRGLMATIDDTAYTITEASIRSALHRTKFLMYPRFLQIILDTNSEDTTPYPATSVTKKIFANMRHYQGPDMPLLAHMLNLGEPAFVQAQQQEGPDMPLLAHMLNLGELPFVQAQQQEVAQPPPSAVVAPHPSLDPMPLPPRQSSPPPIPFGLAPTSGVVSTDPILDIPSSSKPSEPVLETITSPFRDDDTGGGSFYESPPRPHPATLTRSLTVGVAEEPLTLTSLLALFLTYLIKKLKSKLKTKKRKLVLSDSKNEEEERQFKELDALLDLANVALYEPSVSTTPSKPAHPEQSSEQEISPTTLDAVLTLSQSKARARAATIIYKCLKKQQDPFKGKAVATPSSHVTAPTAKELADQQAAILESERQELLKQELKQSIDAKQDYLDSLLAQRVALNLSNEEWIGLVDQVRANPTLSAELLGVSEDIFSIRMVELMNNRQKAIAEMKAKAKREKPMTPTQQKEFMRTFVKN
nr:xylulose kinase-1 [Tanacetum cinerariifolium]